jgi:hypothetical protein
MAVEASQGSPDLAALGVQEWKGMMESPAGGETVANPLLRPGPNMHSAKSTNDRSPYRRLRRPNSKQSRYLLL